MISTSNKTNYVRERNLKSGIRLRIQRMSGFINGMIVPNISIFLAWGILGSLFLHTGWLPNERFAGLVRPISIYLIPLLIAFMGGKQVDGDRGGTAGALGTIGMVIGSDTPMFLGAMIIGPLTAFLIRKCRTIYAGRVRSGFEMLTENFTIAVVGLIMCLISNAVIGPVFLNLNHLVSGGVHFLIGKGLLPLLAFINEPAKALFLNNVIDQGIYYPIGMQDALTGGKSVFFMVASNPGAGLGLLMAYAFFSSGNMKKTAPGAMIIHFLGGIHEMYIPYVLMKPLTIIGMIAGSAAGIMVFIFTGAGLTAGPSPGSFFSYLLLTPKGSHVGTCAGVLVAALVSFAVNSVILKITWQEKEDGPADMRPDGTDAADIQPDDCTGGADMRPDVIDTADIHAARIAFACDLGLGTSVMGAVNFRKRLRAEGIEMAVGSYAVEKIPEDTEIIVTQRSFEDRARRANPFARIVTVIDFLHDPNLDLLFYEICRGQDH